MATKNTTTRATKRSDNGGEQQTEGTVKTSKTTTKGSSGKATTAGSTKKVQTVSSAGVKTVDADKVPTYSGKGAGKPALKPENAPAQDKAAGKPARAAKGAEKGKDAASAPKPAATKPSAEDKAAERAAKKAAADKAKADAKAAREDEKAAKKAAKDAAKDAEKAAGVRDLSKRHEHRPAELSSLIPPAGTVIKKKFKGVEYEFKMLEGERVEFQGEVFSGLWAAGKKLTGYPSLNPYTFFGLKKPERKASKSSAPREVEPVEEF